MKLVWELLMNKYKKLDKLKLQNIYAFIVQYTVPCIVYTKPDNTDDFHGLRTMTSNYELNLCKEPRRFSICCSSRPLIFVDKKSFSDGSSVELDEATP